MKPEVPHWLTLNVVFERTDQFKYHVFTERIASPLSFLLKLAPGCSCIAEGFILYYVVGILPVADKAEGNYGYKSYIRLGSFYKLL